MYLHTTTDGEGESEKGKKMWGREKTQLAEKKRKSPTLSGVCRCNTRVPRVAGRLASRVAKKLRTPRKKFN